MIGVISKESALKIAHAWKPDRSLRENLAAAGFEGDDRKLRRYRRSAEELIGSALLSADQRSPSIPSNTVQIEHSTPGAIQGEGLQGMTNSATTKKRSTAKTAAPAKMEAAKSTRGRKSEYNEEMADRICEQLALGRSLVNIAKDAGMPTCTTVYKWIAQFPEFADKYARARETQADVLAEEVLSISDDGINDTYVDENGNQRTDHDVIARSRLRVDSRKWYLSKVAPKKYGDRLDLNHGGQADNPMQVLMAQVVGKFRVKE